jgi:S1-C subfamily serine protease
MPSAGLRAFGALSMLTATGILAAASPGRAFDPCSNPAGLTPQERTQCSVQGSEGGGTRTLDSGTGLQVVELTTDLDWKNANKASIPWSKVVKIRSALDGTYELAVFDRDYTTDFNTGAKEGVATKWTIDTLKGVVFTAGGCGFWTCTAGRGTVIDLPDVVELHTSGKSYRLYGSSGEFPLPQAFIDDLIAAGPQASLSLKLIRGSTGGSVVPIGKGTVTSLQQLYSKAIQTWEKPSVPLAVQTVSSQPLNVEAIATNSLPSVVMLKNERGLGSGFVIASNGLILTNRHVTAGGSKKFQISAEGGSKAEGDVIYVDRKLDFALVRAPGLSRLKPLPLCYASYPRPGQSVVALGSPLGLAGTVTQGIVSAVRAPSGDLKDAAPNYVTLIQTDASISQGNSGGPLLNSSGEVIGVNTWALRGDDGRAQNLNFAISIVDVLKSLEVRSPGLIKGANACGNQIAARP